MAQSLVVFVAGHFYNLRTVHRNLVNIRENGGIDIDPESNYLQLSTHIDRESSQLQHSPVNALEQFGPTRRFAKILDRIFSILVLREGSNAFEVDYALSKAQLVNRLFTVWRT